MNHEAPWTPARVVLLGPQRRHPDLGAVAGPLADGTPVALVTAGWQEWEDDDARIRDILGSGAFNLRLWGRADQVWREDRELAAAHRRLQDDVRDLRRAYNVRLARAMDAWIALHDTPGRPEVMDRERDEALAAVQALDRHHARRVSELRGAFYRDLDPLMRGSVGKVRDEIRRGLEGVKVVVVMGGHVPALLNRLRLFGVDGLLGGRTVVACSGGAMALAGQVVLFHDSPPWGPGHAEMGEVGLGLFPGVVALPDASARLRLDDGGRVSRMARRFAPDVCVALDEGTRLEWDGAWHPHGARRLSGYGWVEPWSGAA
jgi:hypothetical protein